MRKYCHQEEDVPKGAHFAILFFRTVYIPGDERSQTHPGHGYPASNESVCDYVAYDNRDEWEAEIRRLASPSLGRTRHVPLVVQVPKVETKVQVSVVGGD